MLFIFINQNSICNPSLNYLYAFNVRLINIYISFTVRLFKYSAYVINYLCK